MEDESLLKQYQLVFKIFLSGHMVVAALISVVSEFFNVGPHYNKVVRLHTEFCAIVQQVDLAAGTRPDTWQHIKYG